MVVLNVVFYIIYNVFFKYCIIYEFIYNEIKLDVVYVINYY